MGSFFDSGSDTQTTVQKSEPPAYVEPYIKQALGAAQGLYGAQGLYKPQMFNAQQGAGISQIGNVAQSPQLSEPAAAYARGAIGGQYLPQAQNTSALNQLGGAATGQYLPGEEYGTGLQQLHSTAGGHYLDPGMLQEAAQPAIDMALQGVRSGFEGSGGTGGSMEAMAAGEGAQRALANQYNIERQNQQAASNALAGIYGQERGLQQQASGALGQMYGQERGLQQQALALSPTLEAARLQPGKEMLALGDYMGSAEQRYYGEPWDRLGRYTQIALGNAPAAVAGGTTTGQQPIYTPSPFSQGAGIGLALLGMGG